MPDASTVIHHTPGHVTIHVRHNVSEPPIAPVPAVVTTLHPDGAVTPPEQLREAIHVLGHALAAIVDVPTTDAAILADIATTSANAIDLARRTTAAKNTAQAAVHATALAAFTAKEG